MTSVSQRYSPFAEQQQQALRDAFITDGNLSELADGLGTTLGGAYVLGRTDRDRDHFTSVSQAVADLIAYTNATTMSASNAGKYFSPMPTTDGRTPVLCCAADIRTSSAVVSMSSGRTMAVRQAAGRRRVGNSRPFQTEPQTAPSWGKILGVPANSTIYNRGPVMNLIDSPSFPSGHTTYGYWGPSFWRCWCWSDIRR